MPSPFINNEFIINNKSNNGDNNIIAIIKRLFMNIRPKLLYKRLANKMMQKA